MVSFQFLQAMKFAYPSTSFSFGVFGAPNLVNANYSARTHVLGILCFSGKSMSGLILGARCGWSFADTSKPVNSI